MMEQTYKKILLAVELDPTCDHLPLLKAKAMADDFQAELFLLHAVEHLSSYGAAYGVAAGADIEEMLLNNAHESIRKVAKQIGVLEDKQLIQIGSAKVVILEESQKLGVDLIIVGSHGRHGFRLLLGSTANAVLHGAKCDVLAVRVKE
jgi:universal stress protein A